MENNINTFRKRLSEELQKEKVNDKELCEAVSDFVKICLIRSKQVPKIREEISKLIQSNQQLATSITAGFVQGCLLQGNGIPKIISPFTNIVNNIEDETVKRKTKLICMNVMVKYFINNKKKLNDTTQKELLEAYNKLFRTNLRDFIGMLSELNKQNMSFSQPDKYSSAEVSSSYPKSSTVRTHQELDGTSQELKNMEKQIPSTSVELEKGRHTKEQLKRPSTSEQQEGSKRGRSA